MYDYKEAIDQSIQYFNGDELAANVFLGKYALRDNAGNLMECSPEQMHRRLAKEFARIENSKFKNPLSESQIFDLFDRFKYIVPQGSPMFGIGNDYQLISISNCYVVESPLDTYSSIMKTDHDMVQISKRRGGVGTDISHIRPAGVAVHNASRSSTGILGYMERYSNTIREVGQCLHENTCILTQTGLKEIKHINSGEKVWCENGWVSVNRVIKNKKPCLKISTKSGRNIICSKDHILHSIDGEKSAGNFKIGDSITSIIGEGWETKVEIPLENINCENYDWNNHSQTIVRDMPKTLTKELAYLIGYSYGDGYVDNKNNHNVGISLSLSNDWPDIKEKLINAAELFLNYKGSIKSGCGNCEILSFSSVQLTEFLRINGLLKEKANKIKFPEKILNSNSDIFFSFISGFFDADGSVIKSKKSYKICSIVKSFLEKIQYIFMAHGIACKIHTENRSKLGWQDLHTLTISGQKSQTLFRKYMNESIKVNSVQFKSKVRDFTRTNYKIKDFGSVSSKHTYIIDNNQYITYSTSDRLLKDLNLNKNVRLLQDYVSNIEEYENGIEQDVYDLCLDHTHLFSANGFYVHNSGRRGALMLTLDIHHPECVIPLFPENIEKVIVKGDGKSVRDIETTNEFYDPNKLDFCTVKFDRTKVTGANISIRLSKEFLDALEKNEKFEQRWPVDAREKGKEPVISNWVDARKVWKKIIHAAWQTAEPGIINWHEVINYNAVDCYNKYNFNTTSTNPCSELPLCVEDSCRLLLQNLFGYVENPFTENAKFNFDLFENHAKIAQRLMDDMIDLEIEKIDKIIAKIDSDPEPEDIKKSEKDLWIRIRNKCVSGRRTGTGITAEGDMLAALGLKYGSEESISFVEKVHKIQKLASYRSSVDMAKELSPFPIWNWELEKDSLFLQQIKQEDLQLYIDISKYGRRNIANLTIAPTGSVSILTQTTGGIEPLFNLNSYTRRKKINPGDNVSKVDFIDQNGDRWQNYIVYHPKVKMWMDITGKSDTKESPWFGCCAEDLDWTQRVKLQAAAQKHIDHAISSTINLPSDVSEERVAEIYETAFKLKCKGMTVYRDGCRSGVLIKDTNSKPESLQKTNAPKRPKELNCDIYHTKANGDEFFVLVSLYHGLPYEVFAGKDPNNQISHQKTGTLKKTRRGHYTLTVKNKECIENVCDLLTDEQAVITRLISLSLRHGAGIEYVVDQLEKSPGGMTSYGKALSRVLKKYIPNGLTVTGQTCSNCGSSDIVRQEGCLTCKSCGNSKCS